MSTDRRRDRRRFPVSGPWRSPPFHRGPRLRRLASGSAAGLTDGALTPLRGMSLEPDAKGPERGRGLRGCFGPFLPFLSPPSSSYSRMSSFGLARASIRPSRAPPTGHVGVTTALDGVVRPEASAKGVVRGRSPTALRALDRPGRTARRAPGRRAGRRRPLRAARAEGAGDSEPPRRRRTARPRPRKDSP